ncbi:YgjP-like metallopeptidase domain-containing protein [Metamycoplasma equirhinis]|uniref:YgjP-like metallopeptidase domain-containing protein n=1 Tax=Metamycoplasma equirhinis TaxID=92402 RepID=UPI0035947696
MRKIDEVQYYTYDDKEYKVNVIFKDNLHTYFKEINGEFFLYTNIFNYKNESIKNFVLASISKFLSLKPRKEKPLLDINWKENIFFLFGRKTYFTLFEKQIILYDSKSDLIIDKIKCSNAAFISKKLWEYLKTVLKKQFIEFVNHYMHIILEKQFSVSIKISKKKSAWATNYVTKKIITVSQFLIFYNPEYIKYVALHEVTHFIEQNHSSAFWNIVKNFCPNYKNIRKKLNNHIFE